VRSTLSTIFIALFILTACGNQTDQASKTEDEVQADIEPIATVEIDNAYYEIDEELLHFAQDFPNVASSTSAKPLWQAIMCEIFNTPCQWDSGPFWVERFYQPEYSYPYREEFLNFMSSHNVATGTHDAYLSLIDGSSDIILVARPPSKDELGMADLNGVELDIQPVALDAFVFIVNVHNPVDNLSLEQIRGMYSGEITNWKEVGGPDEEIQVYQRNDNSGSQELMKSLVMKDLAMIDAPDDMVLFSMTGPYSVLSSGSSYVDSGDVNGIAYSVYFYAQNIAPHDDIEFIAIDGVEPTTATIANGRYPLAAEVYLVIRDDMPKDSIPVQLRDWLLTNHGQFAVSQSGYVRVPNE